ncbi:MAG: protein-glutamate O-methyltransferase CheR, partial [Gammaproteobacteria bacterium]|nr:protein-glutamate O-methyltransferase CheR [Gammaproteobacteria bacterium]
MALPLKVMKPTVTADKAAIEQLEFELLFTALQRRYGWDFRHYAYDSARRRVLHRLKIEKIASIGALQHLALYDQQLPDRLITDLSINVTEMFRDPPFFLCLRETILPLLHDEEHLKIWHAGCASGEEVYSMAILLAESDLAQQSQIYGTDFNPTVLERARNGIFSLEAMQQHVKNYHASGGRNDFSDYYHARYDGAAMDNRLKHHLIFSRHDLTSDAAFGEMQIIICRNVLIYFDQTLKERVLQLFLDSLTPGGFL